MCLIILPGIYRTFILAVFVGFLTVSRGPFHVLRLFSMGAVDRGPCIWNVDSTETAMGVAGQCNPNLPKRIFAGILF
jgi:hypothetical protein